MKSLIYFSVFFVLGLFSCRWELLPISDEIPPICEKNCNCPDSIIDERDGFKKFYKTGWIDSSGGNNQSITGQCWMKENLYVGTPVARITDMIDNKKIEKLCNTSRGSCDSTKGGYYTWDEAMNYRIDSTSNKGSICPDGWHIPSRFEMETLIKSLDTNLFKFKSSIFLMKPNGLAKNPSGTGIPIFETSDLHTFYWTKNDSNISSDKIKDLTWIFIAYGDGSGIYVAPIPPLSGDSTVGKGSLPKCLRCIKD